MLEPEGKT